MTRQEANKAILELLEKYIDKEPTMRFNQILVATGLTQNTYDFDTGNRYNHVDFYEEPQDTLPRLRLPKKD